MCPPPLPVDKDTTPQDALSIAHASGQELNRRGAAPFDFVHYLGALVHVPHTTSRLVPFLTAGFSAGYFNNALPDFERVAKRCAAQEKRRVRRSTPRLSRQAQPDMSSQASCGG